MKLLKFELKKTWRRKQFILLLILTVVFVLGLFYRNVLVQDEIANEAIKNLEPHIHEANTLLADFEREMGERSVSESFLEGYENAIVMNETVRDWEFAIQGNNWVEIPVIEERLLQAIIRHMEFEGKYEAFQAGELEQALEKNTILLEHGLPYEDDRYSLTVSNFMKSAATYILGFYGVLIFILILGDQLSVEIEHNTIRTLYTQPLIKWRIILSKFVSMIIAVLFAVVVFFGACLLIPLAFGEQMGSFSYPQLVLSPDGFTYISIGQYLFKLVTLFVGGIIFSISLTLLFSLLVKNRFGALITTLLTLLVAVIATNQSEKLQIGVNPFSYFRFVELIERPNALSQFPNVLVLMGFAILVLLICYILQRNGGTIGKEKPIIVPFRGGETLRTSNQLMSVLAFERRKLWRQGFLKQVVILLLLLIVGGYFFLTYLTKEKELNFVESLKEDIRYTEQELIPEYRKSVEEQQMILDELNEKDTILTESEEINKIQAKSFLQAHQNLLDFSTDDLKRSKSELETYKGMDWARFYEHWINKNNFRKGEVTSHSIQAVDNAPTERIGLSDFTYAASIREKELMAERQLRPVLPIEYVTTIFDHFPNPVDRIDWNRKTQKIDNTGLFYVYTFFDTFIYLLLIGLLVFIFGIGFTTEKGRKRTLTLLVTQPLSRLTIFSGKTGISLAISFLIAIGSILLMFLLGTIGNRFGDWNYPILFYETSVSDGEVHFIHMGRYLIESSVLFLGAILFLLALSLLISLFFNSVISTLTATLVVAIGGYLMSASSVLSTVSHWSPFTYLNVGRIANGEMGALLFNQSIQTPLGLGVFIISSLILFGLSLMWFQTKRMKVF